MATSTDVLSAIKELASNKQLDRENLLDLLRDGIHAALVKKYGPTVRSEIEIDEMKGNIRVAILKTVVEQVEDPVSQVPLEEARFEDPDFQPGDVQWLRNAFVLHKRTAYEDHPEPARKRHLLRLWLAIERLADGTPRFPIDPGRARSERDGAGPGPAEAGAPR